MKILIPLLMMLIFSIVAKAQDMLPFATNNYAGVSAVHLQPASIADSRFKFDMALVSGSAALANTAVQFKGGFFTKNNIKNVFNTPEILTDYRIWNQDNSDKAGFMNVRAEAFSMMITLGEKSAIAITPSVRAFLNIDNVSQDLLSIAEAGKVTSDILNTTLTNANLSLQANAWAEVGITYARVLFDRQKHFLKAGTTIKLMQGIGSGYLFGRDINYRFNTEDTLALFDSRMHFGISDNFSNDMKFSIPEIKPNLGFDFGVVYEYRPKWMKYQHPVSDVKSIWNRDEEKYLLKVGVSVTDIGSIKYRKNPNSADFTAKNPTFSTDEFDISDLAQLHSLIEKHFDLQPLDINYRMNLPTAVSLQADVRLARGLYFNILPFVALNNGYNDDNKSHYLTSVSFIPRLDRPMFGISLPVQYNSFKSTNVGLGLRLGPLWLGSDNMLSLLVGKKNIQQLSASFAFKIPVFFQKPRDRDEDNIDDKYDKCPDIPGIAEAGGCPDSDYDGVIDSEDKCPQTAGLKEFGGCPDKDGDSIIDQNDFCPDVPGLAKFNGCPDSDGDEIIDQYDACPFDAGPPSLQGCPDKDNDGIADKDDDCPTVPGVRQNKGCPIVDSDGDGLVDDQDNCPTLKGPAENMGCPYTDSDQDGLPDKDDECPTIAGLAVFRGCPDTDGDGISDKFDQCPTIAGVPQNNGCPEIKKEEQEILRKAFENLEFETGKAVIRPASLPNLDELAGVLLKRPEFMLSLSGHTDNAGKPEANMVLSKNRTLAVKNYLVKKGVAESRIRAEWFGQTMPVASNATAEGRQMNRRVEMKIIFE